MTELEAWVAEADRLHELNESLLGQLRFNRTKRAGLLRDIAKRRQNDTKWEDRDDGSD